MSEIFERAPPRAVLARGREDLLRMPAGAFTATLGAAFGFIASFWYWFTVDGFGDTGVIYMGMALMAMIGIPVFWGATRPIRSGDRLPLWPGFGLNGAGDDILIGVLIGLLFVLMAGVGTATGSVSAAIPLPPFAQAFPGADRLIAVVFLAPLIEEVFMRGWLFGMVSNALRRRGAEAVAVTGAEVAASIVSAVVFAMFHVAAYGTGLTTAFFTVALFGVVVGLANARGGRSGEGSLWAGWVAHTIYNGVLFTLSFGVGVQIG